MTLLSIVVPNYNYSRFADRFWGSIAAQSFSLEKVEIIFVDDGSTDDSLEQAAKWSEIIRCESFTLLTPPRSGKPGAVRNQGLAIAKGRFLLCVDPDDSLHPEYLKRCLEILESDPASSLVYTDYLEIHPDKTLNYTLPDFKPVYLRTQNIISPAAVYSREIWDAGVRYRENTTYEDWGFWIQCLMAGAKFRHIPEPLYNYHIHDSNFSQSAVKEDGAAKAHIVLNNRNFFHPVVQDWARDYLRGRAHSPAFPRGYIPTPKDVKKILRMIAYGVVS